MGHGIVYRGIEVTSESRLLHLLKLQKKLTEHQDDKMNQGCRIIDQDLPRIKATVLAQVFGILGKESMHHDIGRRAFRWLIAHTDTTSDMYNLERPQHRWEQIMQHYFSYNHGTYGEVALLERILLTLLKSNEGDIPMSDIFMSDRMGDCGLKSDWMMHQQMTNGVLHTSFQLTVNESGKRKDLLGPYIHDRKILEKHSPNLPPVVRDFMRHNTAILRFPNFQFEGENRAQALRSLLSGSTRFQSEIIASKGNKSFNSYGRQLMDVLKFFHRGIISRLIDSHYKLDYHTFAETNDATGETIAAKIENIEDVPILTLKLTERPIHSKPPSCKPNIKVVCPLTYQIPIPPDFLDIYRDMAGVRAQ